MSKFNPFEYWYDRGGDGYMASIAIPEYQDHLRAQEDFIRCHVLPRQPLELLDFGCGTGKLFHLWQGVQWPQGYDISPTMLNVADKTKKQVWGEQVRDWQMPLSSPGKDRTKLPYRTQEFDCVVACEVLAHVIPDEIHATIKELARIINCHGFLAIITAAPFGQGAAHNFDYNYEELLAEDFVIVYDKMCEPYRHMIADKKNRLNRGGQ